MSLLQKNPKISIVMPVYNAEQFLHRSIESVLSQDYTNLELILIDDESTDKSIAICEDYCTKDQRVRLNKQQNGGPSAARNNGINHITGDYLFFLDADDFLEPQCFFTLLSFGNEEDNLILGNFQKVENSGETVIQPMVLADGQEPISEKSISLNKEQIELYIEHFLKYPSNHLASYCWARLYKVSVIKEFQICADPKMKLFEDFVLNLHFLHYCNSIKIVNRPIYNYVMHNSHQSASMGILNSYSLERDMTIFRNELLLFFSSKDTLLPIGTIHNLIGHTLIHYLIIFMIRSCRDIQKSNKKKIHRELKNMAESTIIKESLPSYRPQKGNSRLIPFLVRLKAISLLMKICHKKAIQRYGKMEISS